MIERAAGPRRGRIRLVYGLVALALFGVEVAIAKGWISGPYVRGSLGDVLVIALLYALFRAATLRPMAQTALAALGVGIGVEMLQSIHIADRLGLAPGSILHVVIGNTFSWGDLAMYALGAGLAYGVDRRLGPSVAGDGQGDP